MDYRQLKIIDFSQGIKSSEVMNNDLSLQEQIERERLAIAGYGINFGLELELIEPFKLQIANGTIVDKEGKEQFIQGRTFNIDKPNLILKKQRLFSTDKGVIILDDIPYSENRTEPSEFTESNMAWGIDAYHEDDPSTELFISAIKGNTVYTSSKNDKRAIIVNYNAAYDRIDTVYINTNYQISIKAGIDSTTPSAYIPEDCKYVLGFLKIVSHFYDEEKAHPIAKVSIIKEFNNRRTIYTDLNNNLYLCGIPFESLLRIYFEEPKEPKEGMLWYDMTTNKLKIWRRTDFFMFTDIVTYTSINPADKQIFKTSVGYRGDQLSVYVETRANSGDKVWSKLNEEQLELFVDLEPTEIGKLESKEFRIIPKIVPNTKVKYTINRYDDSYYWVPINDTSYISANEYKMWAPNIIGNNLVEYLPGLNLEEMQEDRPNHDLKNFLFKSSELNLRFTPYKNELSLMIDQIPLHRDQFVEITVEDILNDSNLTDLAINHYGYTTAFLQDLKETYKEIGLGFKLVNSLDKPAFIEVNIQHRVNDSILKNKFQRNATFAKTQTLVYDPDSGLTPLSKTDNSIQVFTLVPYKYGEEQLEVFIDGKRIKNELITEVTSGDPVLGAMCKQFSLKPNEVRLTKGSEITYKITTNVYSYDHVESVIKESQEELNKKIADLEEIIKELKIKIDNIIDY